MAKQTCPSTETLFAFLLGRLPDESSTSIEAHFADCPYCLDRADSISAEDTLTNALTDAVTLVSRLASRTEVREASPLPTEHRPKEMLLEKLDLSFLSPAEAADELGRLNGYRVLNVIGQGGMGIVLLAEDVQLQRKVALKVIKPEVASNAGARERFLREARASAAIHHDHIVTVYQVGEESGVLFLAMQLLKGESLQAKLQSGNRLSVEEVIRIARQIALGIEAAHEHGMTHRDIKPDNIWLEDPNERVKILDFGVATVVNDAVKLTQSGFIVGTPRYLAPEQAQGRLVDHRADLFSIGVVIYRMLIGESPFARPTLLATLGAIGNYEPEPPHQLREDVPKELSRLVMDLLRKDPDERVPSTAELLQRLTQIEQSTELPSHPVASSEDPGDRKLNMILTGLVLSVLLLLGVTSFLFRTPTGEWQLDIYDSDVQVVVKEGDQVVKDLKVLAGEQEKIDLLVGRYHVQITATNGQVVLASGSVQVSRDGKVIASLKQLEQPDAAAAAVQADAAPIDGADSMGALAMVQHPANLSTSKGEAVLSHTLETLPIMGLTAAAVSPNGEYVATFGDDGMIRIWDTDTLELVQMLIGHSAGPLRRPNDNNVVAFDSLIWSPDGRQLAVADTSGELRVWEVDSSRLLGAYRCEHAKIERFLWSPDGSLLAARYNDPIVRVLNKECNLVSELVHPRGTPSQMAWAPDSRNLATSLLRRDRLFLWDVHSGKGRQHTWPSMIYPDERSLVALAWSADGERIAASCANGVAVCNVTSGDVETVIGEAGTVAWSIDGTELIVGLASGTGAEKRLRIIRIKSGKEPEQIEPELDPRFFSQPVTSITPLSDGERYLLSLHDGGYIILNINTGIPDNKLGELHAYHFLHASRDGSVRVQFGSILPSVYVRTDSFSDPNARWKPLPCQYNPVGRAAWSASGRLLGVYNHFAGITVFDLAAFKVVHQFSIPEQGSGALTLAFSPNDEYLFASSSRSKCAIFSLATGEQVAGFDKIVGAASVACFSPDGSELSCAGTLSGPVSIHRSSDGLLMRSWPVPTPEFGPAYRVQGLAWSPDGTRLAVSTSSPLLVTIYDAQTGEVQATLTDFPHVNSIDGHVAWSPDGKHLVATGDWLGTGSNPNKDVITKLVVWDTSTWKAKLTRPVAATALRFVDETTLVYATRQGEVIYEDVAQGTRLRQIQAGAGGQLMSLKNDGQQLLALNGGRIGIWNLNDGSLHSTILPYLSSSVNQEWAVIFSDGNYTGPPEVYQQFRHVVQMESETRLLMPFDFRNEFGWKNKPARAGTSVY